MSPFPTMQICIHDYIKLFDKGKLELTTTGCLKYSCTAASRKLHKSTPWNDGWYLQKAHPTPGWTYMYSYIDHENFSGQQVRPGIFLDVRVDPKERIHSDIDIG